MGQKEANKVFAELEKRGITKKELLLGANRSIKEARTNGITYDEDYIKNSKHPRKKCKLCGQKGCDKKFGGFYFHNKCYRIMKKNGLDMMGDNV